MILKYNNRYNHKFIHQNLFGAPKSTLTTGERLEDSGAKALSSAARLVDITATALDDGTKALEWMAGGIKSLVEIPVRWLEPGEPIPMVDDKYIDTLYPCTASLPNEDLDQAYQDFAGYLFYQMKMVEMANFAEPSYAEFAKVEAEINNRNLLRAPREKIIEAKQAEITSLKARLALPGATAPIDRQVEKLEKEIAELRQLQQLNDVEWSIPQVRQYEYPAVSHFPTHTGRLQLPRLEVPTTKMYLDLEVLYSSLEEFNDFYSKEFKKYESNSKRYLFRLDKARLRFLEKLMAANEAVLEDGISDAEKSKREQERNDLEKQWEDFNDALKGLRIQHRAIVGLVFMFNPVGLPSLLVPSTRAEKFPLAQEDFPLSSVPLVTPGGTATITPPAGFGAPPSTFRSDIPLSTVPLKP